jgi:hypothetical protein
MEGSLVIDNWEYIHFSCLMDSSSVQPQYLYSHLLNVINALTPTFIIGGLSRVC